MKRPISPPHLHSGSSARIIRLDMLIALLPVLIWSICIFGFRALTFTLIAAGSAVITELWFSLLTRRTVTIDDLSALINGILTAFLMPVSVPLWLPALGGILAELLFRQLPRLFGWDGIHPAAGAVSLLTLLFSRQMTAFPQGEPIYSPLLISPELPDGISHLAQLKNGTLPEIGYLDLVLGNHGGTLGEISVLLLAAGGIYLLAKKVISWHIPAFMLLSFAALANVFAFHANTSKFMLMELLCGSLMLGAFFLAPDCAYAPMTSSGKILYGLGCGVLVFFFRWYGFSPEGVPFALTVMSLTGRLLDHFTRPTPFGALKSGGKGKKEE